MTNSATIKVLTNIIVVQNRPPVMSVPQFGGWVQNAPGATDYTVMFTQARENKRHQKNNLIEIRRKVLGVKGTFLMPIMVELLIIIIIMFAVILILMLMRIMLSWWYYFLSLVSLTKIWLLLLQISWSEFQLVTKEYLFLSD